MEHKLILYSILAHWLVHSTAAVVVDSPQEWTNGAGSAIRVSSYGEGIVRIQSALPHQQEPRFLPDGRYSFVEDHSAWSHEAEVDETSTLATLETDVFQLGVDKETLATTFSLKTSGGGQLEILEEFYGVRQRDNHYYVEYDYRRFQSVHFTGLGHNYLGEGSSVDLTGQLVKRNYGSNPSNQAPLIVPFLIAQVTLNDQTVWFGIFLHTSFPNTFKLIHQESGDKGPRFLISMDDYYFNGRFDRFIIAGPTIDLVLDRYTQLTGRPRLPPKSIFGLQLSDKGNDHTVPEQDQSDEIWWKAKVLEHKAAGFPLDHLVNDNRWRAAGGKRCESKLEWDLGRFPDPQEWQTWLKTNGLTSTIDFNRCIAAKSDGWKTSWNLSNPSNLEFPDSAPDLTNPEFRKWFFDIFYEKSLNPQLGFPGDALWIDEFDEQGGGDSRMILNNGWSFIEGKNHWFLFIGKALVGDGWDKSNVANKRPFVWVRGMTAGGQRYGTLWSGDIQPNYSAMRNQVQAMQLAGLSGFPYWSHDAGGFYDWNAKVGPTDEMYVQWSMAFGSFAPIWRPHGIGKSRWPLDRNSQDISLRYGKLRYELMPYTYSLAHVAAASGMPIARAMIVVFPDQLDAWEHPLQYCWGPNILVRPVYSDTPDQVSVWLPQLRDPPDDETSDQVVPWWKLRTSESYFGGKLVTQQVGLGDMPLFVRSGSIIPTRKYAQSTFAIDKAHLGLEVYWGASGQFTLYEDDDYSESYRNPDQIATTKLTFDIGVKRLTIDQTHGSYPGMVMERSYTVRVYGIPSTFKNYTVAQDGQSVPFEISNELSGVVAVSIPSKLSVGNKVEVYFDAKRVPPLGTKSPEIPEEETEQPTTSQQTESPSVTNTGAIVGGLIGVSVVVGAGILVYRNRNASFQSTVAVPIAETEDQWETAATVGKWDI